MLSDFRSATTILSFVTIFLAVLASSAVCGEEQGQKDTDVDWIGGKVIWQGHDLSRASVSVFKDPQFKELYTKGMLLGQGGAYTLRIDDPGTYYVVAFVDANGNNQFDAGDGMGIYGVAKWEDREQKPMPVQVQKGGQLLGVDIQILAIVDDKGRMVSISVFESASVSGVSGKLIWPNPPSEPLQKGSERKFSNTILFVYSDPSWNNRIAQTEVAETGEYKIDLPAGRYYLLAVVDENDTNLLDAGDKFGIWGMTRFGTFPKAVEVKERQITRNRNILIIAYMDASGKPRPLQGADEGQAEKAAQLADKIILSGNVIWPDHDLKFGIVQAYSDPSMTVAVAQAKIDDKGRFRLAVPPGDYYIVVGVDLDGDGKYTSGDGIGAYGVANAADQTPKTLTVTKDSQNKEINLVITAQFDDSGQLKPLSEYSMLDAEYSTQDSGTQYTGISGKIVWEGHEVSTAMLIFSNEPRFETGVRIPLQLDEDGVYNCSMPPGDYYVMAIAELRENDETDSGGGRGFYGSGYWDMPPQRVTVLEEHITPFININVAELLEPDGTGSPFLPPGSVRLRYGDPDDVNINRSADPAKQEWWYWSEGVAFTFEETDAGWNLTDTYEFDPRNVKEENDVEQPQTKEKNAKGTLYYTSDRSIWAVDADGADRKWIAPGSRPTASLDGSKLLFPDTHGSVYLVESDNGASAEAVLGRRKAALQPAISYDGKVMAFTLDGGDYRQMILKNLDTGEESAAPVGAMDIYDPAWSPDGELIAYSASPPSSSDQRDYNRDIYYYDLTAGQTKRVSMNQLDEFNPAWSPVDKRVLIYCRAEGDHAQLWRVDFNDDGKPVERQLTKYGGRNPAWSPGGDKIIYESNAQLWTINPDGTNEIPLTVDGEPIFGMDPFWTR